MPKGMCSVDDCDSPQVNSRGWCNRHYIRWRKYGDPLGEAPPRPRTMKPSASCVVEGCTRDAETRGWCDPHYKRWWRYGDPLGAARASPEHGTRQMYLRGCRCEPCKAAESEYKKAYRAKNPEKVAGYYREWHLKNKERRNARRLELYRANKEQEQAKARKYLYGLTGDSYNALLAMQGGACAICKTVPGPDDVQLHVDHDYSCCPVGKKSCGKCVRGLLCQKCNHAIGLMRDNPKLLRAAANYLEKPQLVVA